ncbi:MAG: hypothetical protein KAJ04_07455, partial [Candidatus Eisenbacteria sp.]|nr:hypothetical protein [Candidatus Eisenbacteria bacterium]
GSAYVSWAKALEHKADARCEAGDYDGGAALYGQAIGKLEQARMDSNWRSHANREIERQNQLIEVAQLAKRRGIWDKGELAGDRSRTARLVSSSVRPAPPAREDGRPASLWAGRTTSCMRRRWVR